MYKREDDPHYEIVQSILRISPSANSRDVFELLKDCLEWKTSEDAHEKMKGKLNEYKILSSELSKKIDQFHSQFDGVGKFTGFNGGWNTIYSKNHFKLALDFLREVALCEDFDSLTDVAREWEKPRIGCMTPSRFGILVHMIKPDLVAIYNKVSKAYLKEKYGFPIIKDVIGQLEYSKKIKTLFEEAGVNNFSEFDIKLQSVNDDIFRATASWIEKHTAKESLVVSHQRNRALVKAKKDIANGVCDACNENIKEEYEYDIIEIHHIEPYSLLEENTTLTLDDVCALCPNCHSTIHSYMRDENEIFTKNDILEYWE